jgi:hypothetical protein
MMDMTDLQGDGAQDTERMTDPRAALAEYFAPTDYDDEPQYRVDEPQQLADFLAERGVLLVTVGGLQDAIQTVALHDPSRITSTEYATAIFAALSGEADGY